MNTKIDYEALKKFEKKNSAKIEILALLDTIIEMRSKSYSFRSIFEYFVSKEQFTMHYSTFLRYMQEYKDKIDKPKEVEVVEAEVEQPQQEEQQVPVSNTPSAAPQAESVVKTLPKAGLGTSKQEEVHSNVPIEGLTGD